MGPQLRSRFVGGVVFLFEVLKAVSQRRNAVFRGKIREGRQMVPHNSAERPSKTLSSR